MSNPFSGWSADDATRHNERVARAIQARLANPGVPSDVPGPQSLAVASIEPKTGGKKRVRQSDKPLLNGLETGWRDFLRDTEPKGTAIMEQAVKLRLGNGVVYTADLCTFHPAAGLRFYECKGPSKMKGVSKGLMTLKIAAALYPHFFFVLVWKEDGQFRKQTILP
jgi:hypothetical protein